MKTSWKIFNIIYSVIVLLIIAAGFYLVNSFNTSLWDSRVETVTKSAEYAADSFYSYSELISGRLSYDNLNDISSQIKNITGNSAGKVGVASRPDSQIAEKAPYTNDIQRLFLAENDEVKLMVFTAVNYLGDTYYITLESDFTETSAYAMRNWRLFAWGAAGLLILGGALLVIINLLRKESEKNKKFMENFAHELKTPMTSILGYSSMVSEYELDETERNQALDALSFEAKRLDRLSKQMLELFVLQKEMPEMQPVGTEKLSEALNISLRELSEKYKIPYILELKAQVVECNEILLLSLITNLCDNAFKATVNGMPVEVSGRNANGKYRIKVADHGIGIARKNIDRLIEPFFREDKARARSLGGAGLGLSLCSEIARLHGTKLTFRSAKNKGTMVTFELKTMIN